jgi:transmembrane 9 superfamily protein 2/4
MVDRWHWRAFLTGGGSAFWVFAYGLFYWASRLSLGSLTSVIIYLGYLTILSLFTFLVTGWCASTFSPLEMLISSLIGTIGFLASYWAVRRLYGAIRVD